MKAQSESRTLILQTPSTVNVRIQDLPAAIEVFYEDWNHVARNSTRSEREFIWMFVAAGQAENLASAGRTIAERLQRIDAAFARRSGAMMATGSDTAPVAGEDILVPRSARYASDDTLSITVARASIPPDLVRSIDTGGRAERVRDATVDNLRPSGWYLDRWARHDGVWRLTRTEGASA